MRAKFQLIDRTNARPPRELSVRATRAAAHARQLVPNASERGHYRISDGRREISFDYQGEVTPGERRAAEAATRRLRQHEVHEAEAKLRAMRVKFQREGLTNEVLEAGVDLIFANIRRDLSESEMTSASRHFRADD